MRIIYVVFVGRRPGLYKEWHECYKQVNGYKGAIHKRYSSYEEAERAFLEFWGHSEGVTESSSSSDVTTQSSTRQALIPNEGVSRDESHKRLENIIYVLALVGLIWSLIFLFGLGCMHLTS
jgi:viroplasmin and RNaseH domain-containing protein